jgi:hypothetical protein
MFVECFNLECLVFMCSTTTGGVGHDSSEIVHLPNCKLLSGAKVNWFTDLTLLLTDSILSFCVAVLKLSAMVGSLMD